MRSLPPLLLALLVAVSAAAVTLSDELATDGASEGGPGDRYADEGVLQTGDDGAIWDGAGALAATFDTPVRDVAPGGVNLVNEWTPTGIDAEVGFVHRSGRDDRVQLLGVDDLRWTPADAEPAVVDIEVQPGTRTPLDPSAGGVVGAIVYGTEDFPVQEVDETTLAVGPDGAGIASEATLHFQDVDEDGWLDLIALYPLDETGIVASDPEVCLTGETFAGEPFEGCSGLLVAAAP